MSVGCGSSTGRSFCAFVSTKGACTSRNAARVANVKIFAGARISQLNSRRGGGRGRWPTRLIPRREWKAATLMFTIDLIAEG
jgi:hypothetical protein